MATSAALSRLRIRTTRALPPHCEERLSTLFDCQFSTSESALSKAELISVARSADVLVTTIGDRIDWEVIAAGASAGLRMIANYGAGVDHIHMAAAREFGVIVTNTPGALSEDTADMAMMLILALHRHLPQAMAAIRDGRFAGWSPNWMLGRSVAGKKLGIIGMGRVGQALARRARGFGMAIHYHNRAPVSDAIAGPMEARFWPSLDQMMAQVDAVSIHCPSTPATFHLVSRRHIGLLQPHAIIINTARAPVIDEAALVEALREQRIGGAALDVFDPDVVDTAEISALEGVILTPHIASATQEARDAMGDELAVNIKFFEKGETPPHLVMADL
jgi:glyoxylate reductase